MTKTTKISKLEQSLHDLSNAVKFVIPSLENVTDKNLLINSLKKFCLEFNETFNPVHEWQQDEGFSTNFHLWEYTISPDKGMNKERRLASILELKDKCNSDIELAKEVLLLSTKYASPTFESSIATAKANIKQKPKKVEKTIENTTEKQIDIKTYCKENNIPLIAITDSEIKIGKCDSPTWAKLRKITNLKITETNV